MKKMQQVLGKPFLFAALSFLFLPVCIVAATAGSAVDQRNRHAIVGGTPAVDNAHSAYAVFGNFTDDSFCGGVLIHSDIVLTAAHCFLGIDEEDILLMPIYFGANSLDLSDADEVRTIVGYAFHPDYRSSVVAEYYDFVLLLLDEPSTTATPLEHDTTPDDENTPSEHTIMGFGLTSEDGESSPVLLQAKVVTVDFSECDDKYEDDLEKSQHICAAAPGVDTCQNDSGGPLINSDSVVVGVVSFGEGCGGEFPGVYARVSSVHTFIEEAVCTLSSDPPASCEGEFSTAVRLRYITGVCLAAFLGGVLLWVRPATSKKQCIS